MQDAFLGLRHTIRGAVGAAFAARTPLHGTTVGSTAMASSTRRRAAMVRPVERAPPANQNLSHDHCEPSMGATVPCVEFSDLPAIGPWPRGRGVRAHLVVRVNRTQAPVCHLCAAKNRLALQPSHSRNDGVVSSAV